MKTDNIMLDKSFQFGLKIVKQFIHLRKVKVERELCIQLLKSGTSIGANIEESVGGSSRKDFVYKLEIAYKEAREEDIGLGCKKKAVCQKINLSNRL